MSERTSIWGLRGLALAIALVFWFFVALDNRAEQLSEKQVEANITYNTPRGMIILDPVQKASVRLRGPTREVRNLNPYMVDVLIEVGRAQPGSVEVNLEPRNVLLPEGLEVVSIEPNQIKLRLDREITRLVPVVPRLVGEPAAGAVAEPAQVIPSTALVSGPSSRVEELRTLSTNPVRLDGHALNFEESTAVVSPDPLVQVLQPATVVVRVPMRPPGSADRSPDRRRGER